MFKSFSWFIYIYVYEVLIQGQELMYMYVFNLF